MKNQTMVQAPVKFSLFLRLIPVLAVNTAGYMNNQDVAMLNSTSRSHLNLDNRIWFNLFAREQSVKVIYDKNIDYKYLQQCDAKLKLQIRANTRQRFHVLSEDLMKVLSPQNTALPLVNKYVSLFAQLEKHLQGTSTSILNILSGALFFIFKMISSDENMQAPVGVLSFLLHSNQSSTAVRVIQLSELLPSTSDQQRSLQEFYKHLHDVIVPGLVKQKELLDEIQAFLPSSPVALSKK